MTLPDERYRSLVQTKQFLMELLSAQKTPRVPKHIRYQALGLLRHWPDDYHLHKMTLDMPNYFAEQIEPVTRMLMSYEESKHDNAS